MFIEVIALKNLKFIVKELFAFILVFIVKNKRLLIFLIRDKFLFLFVYKK